MGLGFSKIFQMQQSDPLKLPLEEKSFPLLNPYMEIYKNLQRTTMQVLGKNRFFTDPANPSVFLSRSDLEMIESSLATTISRCLRELEKYLFLLPTIVTLGPFLGLLGTVWGILITVSELHHNALAGSNASFLQGLSMALATTVLGLLVAIPALIANNYLKTSIKDIRKDLENTSLILLGSVELQYRKTE